MHTAYVPVPAPVRPPSAERWPLAAVAELFELPFLDLLHRAQQVHRQHFDANTVQLSSLLSIKTGGCPEDCAYCPQSAHYDTGVDADKLMPLDEVVRAARAAQANGAQRFCMGAAWRSPKPHHLEAVAEMIGAVKALGMETCVTLGMLRDGQAEQLKAAGWITTTTTWIPRPSSTARSFRRAPTRTAWIRCNRCARPASMCAAAASSAWANRAATAPAWSPS